MTAEAAAPATAPAPPRTSPRRAAQSKQPWHPYGKQWQKMTERDKVKLKASSRIHSGNLQKSLTQTTAPMLDSRKPDQPAILTEGDVIVASVLQLEEVYKCLALSRHKKHHWWPLMVR